MLFASRPEPPPKIAARRWFKVRELLSIEVIELTALVIAVFVEKSWAPLMASVLVEESVPAPTFTSFRSLPTLPNETVLATLATELLPIATDPLAEAFAI